MAEAIQLKDKEIFDRYLTEFKPQISELTFTNLFCWSESKKYQWEEKDGHLILSFEEAGKRIYLQPIGPDPAGTMLNMISSDNKIVFERVAERFAEKVKDDLSVEPQRDMFDYVYSIKEMVELDGGDFVEKRNLIRQVEDLEPKICILNESTADQFASLQERWCRMRECQGKKGLTAENKAIIQALKHFRELGFFGVCIRIHGKVEGFAIGEKLNDDTFVEHFEKGNTKFSGIYQYVLNKFSSKIPEGFTYLNREQDLGIAGIRTAKERYNPVKMIKKFRIISKTA